MAGIIEQAVPATSPQLDGKKPVESSPEAMRVEIAAKKILAQPAVAKHMIEVMRTAEDQEQGIGEALMYLVQVLQQKAQNKIPPKALVEAAKAMIVDVAKLGQSAGLFKISKELIAAAIVFVVKTLQQSLGAEKRAQPPAALQAAQSMPMGQEPMTQQGA